MYILAKKGYVINDIKVNGRSVEFTQNGLLYTFVLEDISNTQVVELDIEYVEYDVTTTYNSEQVSVTAPEKVAGNDDYSIVIIPKKGFVIKSITLNGEDVTASLEKMPNGAKFAAFNITEAQAIVIVMEEKTFTITAMGDENSTVQAPTSVAAYESVTFTITLSEGYRIKSITINGKVVSNSTSGTYTTEYVSNDVEFKVVSEAIPTFDETVPGGGKGCQSSVSSMGAILALCGLVIFKNKTNKKRD